MGFIITLLLGVGFGAYVFERLICEMKRKRRGNYHSPVESESDVWERKR